MTESIIRTGKRYLINNLLWDAGFITSFVLITVYSHLLPIPLYAIEPMRIILILSLIYTKKANQYFLASILPVISFAISGHPPIEKSLIIVCELNINVLLFYLFEKKYKNVFVNAVLSIFLSKVIYYFIKFAVFSLILNESFSLEGERIFQQAAVIIVLSGMGWVLDAMRKK